MKIEANKIFSRGCKVQSLADGSVRLIKYEDEKKNKKQELVTLSKGGGYYYDNNTTYTLRVNVPEPPTVARVVLVMRTSVNCWKLVLSSLDGSDVMTKSTLTEVNATLEDFLKK